MTKDDILEELVDIYNDIFIDSTVSSGYMCAQLSVVEFRLGDLIDRNCGEEE